MSCSARGLVTVVDTGRKLTGFGLFMKGYSGLLLPSVASITGVKAKPWLKQTGFASPISFLLPFKDRTLTLLC